MKKKLVFATNNAHKLDEIRAILGDKVEVLSLKDIHCEADIPETADTLEGNAALKAEYIYKNYGWTVSLMIPAWRLRLWEAFPGCIRHVMPEEKDTTRKPT